MKTAVPILAIVYFLKKFSSLDFSFLIFYNQTPTYSQPILYFMI